MKQNKKPRRKRQNHNTGDNMSLGDTEIWSIEDLEDIVRQMKEKNLVPVKLGMVGGVNMYATSERRKYASMRGAIAIHDKLLNEPLKDVRKFPKIYVFAFMDRDKLSDMALELNKQSEEQALEVLKKEKK